MGRKEQSSPRQPSANCGAAVTQLRSQKIIWATLWACCEEVRMLWTPSDGVNIFIVFLLLQSSAFYCFAAFFLSLLY
jgi:hypothetical protein